ncbi:MAG: phosphate transport system substrate-binding protein [Planctomycetota bacterium]|jgi:phosphate transport system substrate-binding protein
MKNLFVAALCLILVSCGQSSDKLSVKIDGSSTVFPITEAVAVEFQRQRDDVRVTIGISGTGGGFKKFTVGETDINDASRLIKDKEANKAKENDINFIELPVAYDGLSVVINKDNDFVDHLTVAELNMIWKVGSKVTMWSDIRAEWPDKEIKLFGPGVDSGTFDYFTEVINHKSGACRPDFTMSEDDNVLVRGIAGNVNALGFFGYAYYIENKNKLKVVPIDNGKGPVGPTMESINSGTYAPLSRPIFIYVSSKAAERKEVIDFVAFYMDNAPRLVKAVGYVPLPSKMYDENRRRMSEKVFGRPNSGG